MEKENFNLNIPKSTKHIENQHERIAELAIELIQSNVTHNLNPPENKLKKRFRHRQPIPRITPTSPKQQRIKLAVDLSKPRRLSQNLRLSRRLSPQHLIQASRKHSQNRKRQRSRSKQ